MSEPTETTKTQNGFKGKRAELTAFDPATGNMVEGATVAVLGRKKRNGFGDAFMMVNQIAKRNLAIDKEMTMTVNRVLGVLEAAMEFENKIPISQKDIAETLGIAQPNVSVALKVLEDKGILLRVRKEGRSPVYAMSPHYAWKGSDRLHLEALKALKGPTPEWAKEPTPPAPELPEGATPGTPTVAMLADIAALMRKGHVPSPEVMVDRKVASAWIEATRNGGPG